MDYTEKSKRTVLRGKKVSEGMAYGKAFLYTDILSRNLLHYTIEEQDIRTEWKRIQKAVFHVLSDLTEMKKRIKKSIKGKHAEIFEVQKMMLSDKSLKEEMKQELFSERINAEQVLRNVLQRKANRFRASEKQMLRDKAEDLEDILRRSLRVLLGYDKNILEKLPSKSIVVSQRLLPSDTVHMKRRNVAGIITSEGGINSHSAILARELGIPALSNIAIKKIHKRDEIIINGTEGKVIISPTKKECKELALLQSEKRKQNRILLRKAQETVLTKKGTQVAVLANASSLEDIKWSVKFGCDGIGLFRIEQLFLASKNLPDEESLYQYFSQVLSEIQDKETTIRLLDIGGDKQLPYLEIDQENSPMLGSRGIRFLLKHEELLETQIRVLIRLAEHYRVKVLIPMVSVADEVKKVRELFARISNDMYGSKKKKETYIKIGAMIETPAAVLSIKNILKYSDLISIGSNDLIQYTMAAGRENTNVSWYYEKGNKIILNFIQTISAECQKKNIPCSICGEMAGDVKWLEKLLKLGLTSFSVSAHRIAEIKEFIRTVPSV